MDIKLIEQALKKPGKSKSGLARALGRQPSAVTDILKGGREIKARELPIIAEYLELRVPEYNEVAKPTPAELSAVETIKSLLERVAELERRTAVMESVMREIGALK
jgi:plasmid maintenance system antidote protein VapI